ncbi:two component regulator with propeller domain [Algoriphagus boseongensis]|uniref:histidine kinase n=1 Tax=Algoriphagus boseongensis TaxID=1442587 RepID=A0A4R6T7M4_9BACT|nr:sensor histidine kinase [Algoriphagus boseongensis]TDQ16918.1 two component regulator with propeller domain [Algoriphagus boseongensis]
MKQLLRYFGISLVIFSCQQGEKAPESSSGAFLEASKVTYLSDLPDSLKPFSVELANARSPRIVPIPVGNVGRLSYFDSNGDQVVLDLLAPKKQELLVLEDQNGSRIKDAQGNSFLLGEGGVSQFKTFTTDDGLALDGVNCAILDRRGHLWFGTNGGGVSRYDGTGFTNFTTSQGLAGNTVRSIWEDSNGLIWFGTLSGISSFDGFSFTKYTLEDGLPNDLIFGVTEDNSGNIWMATGGGGAIKFDGKEFKSYTKSMGLADDFVVAIGKDSQGNLYFGTNGGGMSKFDGSTFTTFTEADGLSGNRVRSFGFSSDGAVWIGTIGNGISRFDGKSFQNFSVQDGLADNIVFTIQEDRNKHLWFGTEHGISRYDGKKFTSYTRDQGLSANGVFDIVMDESGKLWFCTDGGGISRFDGSAFTSFTVNQGLGANIILSSMEDKEGNIWFGTSGGGASKFDGTGFTTYSLSQGMAGDAVYAMIQDSKGFIWFGTGGGLSQFDGKTITSYTEEQGLHFNEIYAIEEDPSGNLWLGTDNGLAKFDGKTFTHYTPDQGLAGYVILSIQAEKNGGLWIGAVDGGLTYFDGEKFTQITTLQGLADNSIIQVKLDQYENLWIGTAERGISFLPQKVKSLATDGNTNVIELFRNFSAEDGLPDEVILQIVPMDNGKVAVGTNLGIAFFDGPKSENQDFNTLENIEVFNSDTGYPVKDLTDGQNGMFQDQNGILWAGTGSNKTALVRFDYGALVRNQNKPKVFLRQLRLNEEVISWNSLIPDADPKKVEFEEISSLGKVLNQEDRKRINDRFKGVQFDGVKGFFPIPEGLVLPYRHNHINIDFGSSELAKPFLVEYQYFLEGYDQDWSPVLRKTSATFGNIHEGDYTFWVKARFTGPSEGDAGEWTEPISFSFTVLPPWYRTWWAYLVYTLLFLSLIYPFYRYQRNKAIKAEQEKARERELEQAKEIEKAYTKLEAAHENLKSTQAQLIQQEKLASLGQLTAGIAHEIKNPLNFVNNFSGLSLEFLGEIEEELEKLEPSDEVENIQDLLGDIRINLEKIRHHGGRADNIVKSMLMHSRGGTGTMEPADLNEVIREYVNLSFHGMRANKNPINVDIVLDLDDQLPKIPLNSEDFSRVILNLTKNAFDAMRDKLDKVGQDYKPKLTVRTKNFENSILLEVEDNGPGVPDEIMDKLLMPFFTTKKGTEGTGLGLSITHDIIKAHNGALEITTKVGEWTKFSISIAKS